MAYSQKGYAFFSIDMLKLFKLENYEVTISEEALTLQKFKRIWDRDRTNGKNKATQELSFIYFFCDPRSDYMVIIDEDTRKEEIKAALGLNESWEPDQVVQEAMEFYKSFKPTICMALDDARIQLEKVRTKLRSIDLSGLKIREISDYIKANKDVSTAIELFCEIERKVNREIQDSSRKRGSGELKIFDTGVVL